MTWKLDHCIHGRPFGDVTEYCPECADEAKRMTVQMAEALAAKEYNAYYVRDCLLHLAAALDGILQRGEPLKDSDREYFRVHLNSVKHEQKKHRTDDPSWVRGRCPCCWEKQ